MCAYGVMEMDVMLENVNGNRKKSRDKKDGCCKER